MENVYIGELTVLEMQQTREHVEAKQQLSAPGCCWRWESFGLDAGAVAAGASLVGAGASLVGAGAGPALASPCHTHSEAFGNTDCWP